MKSPQMHYIKFYKKMQLTDLPKGSCSYYYIHWRLLSDVHIAQNKQTKNGV